MPCKHVLTLVVGPLDEEASASCRTVMAPGIGRLSSPLGPFTAT